MSSVSATRVGVHAALDPRSSGGVQTNLISLVNGLRPIEMNLHISLLSPPFLIQPWEEILGTGVEAQAWPYQFPWYREPENPTIMRKLRWSLSQFRNKGRLNDPQKPERDRLLREFGIELVHFPYQVAFDTSLPSIYEPWDLQHIHLPEFFSVGERRWRTNLYSRACKQATFVVTATTTTKRDLVDSFGLNPEKILVIYRHSSLMRSPSASSERKSILNRFGLTEPFAFFPAMTYPHKNHLRLLKAIAIARERMGVVIPLACSGRKVDDHWRAIASAIEELKLDQQVFFLDHLSDTELSTLFTEARCMVFPSLFEGLGLPLLEAMQFETPIVASNASCIPEVAGDAALLFDPKDSMDIADKLTTLWNDPQLQRDLVAEGTKRRAAFGWSNASVAYAAAYKTVCGKALSGPEKEALDFARSF